MPPSICPSPGKAATGPILKSKDFLDLDLWLDVGSILRFDGQSRVAASASACTTTSSKRRRSPRADPETRMRHVVMLSSPPASTNERHHRSNA